MSLLNLVPIETIEKVLKTGLKYGGEFSEIYIQKSTQTMLSMQESSIRSAESRSLLGAGIRVISGEQTGYAYTDVLTEESLIATADTASRIASGNSGDIANLTQKTYTKPYKKTSYDTINTDEKAKFLSRADVTARSYSSKIVEVQGVYFDELKQVLVANSEGLLVEDTQPMTRLSISATAKDKGRANAGTYGAGSRTDISLYDTQTPEMLAEEAARQAIVQISASETPAGLMPVVIAKGWGGVLLHEAVGHGLEADFNRKGTSLYSGKIGEKVASDICTVIDDGTIPNRRGSLTFDDEGQATGRNVLIENGTLVGYMNDKLNAKLMGASLTGNGRRQSYQFSPIPRMTNTFMAKGESNPDEIIKSVSKGLYAKILGGGQVNITNGNFQFEVAEAYLIENGKLTTPLRGASLIGNGPDALTKVAMVGNDLELDNGVGTCGKDGQGVPVGVGQPTVLISEMTVGGTSVG